jgi:steroid 5-alpha reductase family enzyme
MNKNNSDWPLTAATVVVVVAAITGLSMLAGTRSVSIGTHSALVVCAAMILGIQWLCWIPASWKKTERYYDLTGGVTYLGAIVLSLWAGSQEEAPSTREWILSAMVTVWAVRLASFLFLRIHRAGKDGRFDELKTSPVRFLVPWTLQGLWVFLTLLVVLVINCQATSGAPMGLWDCIGIALWGLGFGIEVVADRQKSAFAARAKTPNPWIDEGLWARSRHPNYFGEILLWSGIALCGVSCFSGGEWAALVSPVFVALLLTKISGVPMLDERSMDRWGTDPAYLAYRARTRMLLPIPRSQRNE